MMIWFCTAIILIFVLAFGWVNREIMIVIQVFDLKLETNLLKFALYTAVLIILCVIFYRGIHYVLHRICGLQKRILPFLNKDFAQYIEELMVAILKKDQKQASRISAILKQDGVSARLDLILDNELALLSGDVEKIAASFEAMLGCRDTLIPALEGLMFMYIEQGDWEISHYYALKLWEVMGDDCLASIHILILLNGEMWEEIWTLNNKIAKFINPQSFNDLKIVACYNIAQEKIKRLEFDAAYKILFTGYKKYSKDFLPVNILLLDVLAHLKQYKEFKKILRESWINNPHSLLLKKVFDNSIAGLEPLSLMKEITYNNQHHYESLVALSIASIIEEQYEEALDYAKRANDIKSTVRTCLLTIASNYFLGHNLHSGVKCMKNMLNLPNDSDSLTYYWDNVNHRITDNANGNASCICTINNSN